MKIDIRKLDVKRDKRGWLAEVVKSEDVGNSPFGLIHITTAKPGNTKGGHFHKRKTEWFCVIRGEGELFLKDLKSNKKKSIRLGEENMSLVKIPPFIFHSIKNIGSDEMYLLAYVSEGFNLGDPDTFREII